MVAVALLTVLAGCRSLSLESRPLADPVSVDGNAAEWRGFEYSLQNNKMTAMLTNDQKDVYVMIAVYDEKLQQRIMDTGLELTLASGANKNQRISLLFPITHRSDRTHELEAGLKPSSDFRDDGPPEWKLTMPDLAKPEIMQSGESNSYGIELVVNKMEKRILFELKVPLKYCTGRNETDIALDRPIKWEIKCHAAIGTEGAGPGPGRGGTGSDRMGGGEPPGGGMGRGPGDAGMPGGGGMGGDGFGGGGMGSGGDRMDGHGPRGERSFHEKLDAIEIKGRIILLNE